MFGCKVSLYDIHGTHSSQLSSVFLSLVLEDHFLLFYVSSTIFSTHPDKEWPFSAPALLLCAV